MTLFRNLSLVIFMLVAACSPEGNTSHSPDAGDDATHDTLGDGDDVHGDSGTGDATGEVEHHSPELEIRIIEVGQGDATIISAPGGKTLLFDTGRKVADGERIGALLWGLSGSDLIMLTSHYDSDHMGAVEVIFSGPDGAPGVAGVDDDGSGGTDETTLPGEYGATGSDDLIPGQVFDRGTADPPTTVDWDQYLAATDQIRSALVPGQRIPMGLPGLTVEVLAVNGLLPDGTDVNAQYENDRSVVLFLRYGGFEMLLPGDLPAYTEALVAQYLADRGDSIDVLHTGHHGSYTATDPVTIALLQPEVAIISVGDSPSCGPGFNAYGHPSQETLDTLYQGGVSAVYHTQEGGALMATGTCTADPSETYPRNYYSMEKYVAYEDILLRTDGTHYTISYGFHSRRRIVDQPVPY